MNAEPGARCRCATPTPVFGNITKSWYCYDCGADIDPNAAGAVVLTGRFPAPSDVGRWATLAERGGR